jgi:hypothetical protein
LASRSLVSLACSLAAALALAAPAVASADAPFPSVPAETSTQKTSYVPGRVNIVWEDDASHADKIAARQDAEVKSPITLGDPSLETVKVESGQSTADAIASLEADPAVASAERDALAVPAAAPNDPLFGQQWALQNTGAKIGGVAEAEAGIDVNAIGAWEQFLPPFVGLPGKGAVVADIDSGYRFFGPELEPVAATGFDFVGANADNPSEDSDPTDDNLISGGHGVHTAGIIGAAGNNGVGISGVDQEAKVMPLRVCGPSPSNGNALRCPISSIAAAISYAGAHGARVANLSLTTPSDSPLMKNAIAANPQTLYVVAAGNDKVDNDVKPHYPCNYEFENVLCVAAINQNDKLATFQVLGSDWGKNSVDLAAPGTEILSTYPVEDLLGEDFEEDDAEFQAKWTGEFGRAEGAPLTSSGMSDSPETPPVAESTRETELTTPIAVPAGYGNCVLSGRRSLALNGGTFTQEVLREGTPVLKKEIFTNSPAGVMQSFTAEPVLTNLAGTNVNVRFRFKASAAPNATDGVWLDDLQLRCYQAPTVAPSYAFLEGTSMAAPVVSGVAGLLFSLHPDASVTGVRNALLESVVPVPDLKGITVTGGRVDALGALLKLDVTPPADPALTTDPATPASSSTPRITGSAEPGSKVRVYLNASCTGVPNATVSAAELGSPGVAVTVPAATTFTFSATATDAAQNVSGCAVASYTNITSLGGGGGTIENPPPPSSLCTVPKVAGKTLAKAKVAITDARCKTGKVTKPKPLPGKKLGALVVKSSSPAAGTVASSGVVTLKLGPKPHARRR